MQKENAMVTQLVEAPQPVDQSLNRRKFLSFVGVGAAASLYLASCHKDDNNFPNGNDGTTLDFKDDFGVLNYAYALEQLEAAFYIKVASAPPAAFTDKQKAYFQDVQYHEIAHREFFKKALGSNAIKSLEVDFSSINFTDAGAVLAAAQTFEDLGVAAYNGAGIRIKDDKFLVVAGQIVSVEARHAAWVRDQISNGSFADLNSLSAFKSDNANGLDGALTPDLVYPLAKKYIKTELKIINLM